MRDLTGSMRSWRYCHLVPSPAVIIVERGSSLLRGGTMTPPVMDDAPATEIWEALHRHVAESRAALERGNELRERELHRQMNRLLDQLEKTLVPA